MPQISPEASPAQMAELRRVFNLFDRDHSGFITKQEYQKAIEEVRFRSKGAKRGEDMMMQSDMDHNGRVSFEEFVEAAMYTTTPDGTSTDDFNALIRVVAKAYVKKNDVESLDYLKQYKFWPPPLFMIIITIIEVAIFIYYAKRECTPDSGMTHFECPLSFSSKLSFRPSCREQAWRFFTYIFVHAGTTHIVFNILIQLLVGFPLEMVHGPFRVLGVYLIGGFAGSLGSSVCDPQTNLVGASAAVYALVGAHVADVFLNWAEMPFRWIRAGVLFVLIGCDFSISIYQRYFNDVPQQVSYVGHLSGFIMGLSAGVYLLRNLRGHPYEKYAGYVTLGISIFCFVFGLFWNIFYDGYPHDTSHKC